MMDLNKIRNMKTLEAIHKPLKDFIASDRAEMVLVYSKHFGWGEEDYEADKEKAEYLLEQVERRMKSLGHHLAKGKNARQSPVPPVVAECASPAA